MAKKIPMRRCVATNESLPKKELLRIVRTTDGGIQIDTTGKLNGHGAYLKKDPKAVQIAKKKGSLKNALGTDIPDEIYDEILSYIQ